MVDSLKLIVLYTKQIGIGHGKKKQARKNKKNPFLLAGFSFSLFNHHHIFLGSSTSKNAQKKKEVNTILDKYARTN